jgi:hypothetical protein
MAFPKFLKHISQRSLMSAFEFKGFDEVFMHFAIRQQSFYQFVAYCHFSYIESFGSFLPLDRLHKI